MAPDVSPKESFGSPDAISSNKKLLFLNKFCPDRCSLVKNFDHVNS